MSNLLIIEHYINFSKKSLFKQEMEDKFNGATIVAGNYNLNITEDIKKNKIILNFEELYDPRVLTSGRLDKKYRTIKSINELFLDKLVYPSPQFSIYISSKLYYNELPKNLKYGEVFVYQNNNTEKLIEFINKNITWSHFVAKTGWTGEKIGFHEFTSDNREVMLKKLIENCEFLYKFFMYPFAVIFQKWNEFITDRRNEYRTFVVDGRVLKYHAHGTEKNGDKYYNIPNSEYNPEIGKLALIAYEYIKSKFPECFYLRVDISMHNNIMYVNEVEILDGTMYYFILNGKTEENPILLSKLLVNACYKWYEKMNIIKNLSNIKLIKLCHGKINYIVPEQNKISGALFVNWYQDDKLIQSKGTFDTSKNITESIIEYAKLNKNNENLKCEIIFTYDLKNMNKSVDNLIDYGLMISDNLYLFPDMCKNKSSKECLSKLNKKNIEKYTIFKIVNVKEL